MSSWSVLDEETRRQIFEKFLNRLRQSSGCVNFDSLDFCPELNPDVIMISGDQTIIIEPQNLEASKWLRRRFGFDSEEVRERERFCVHPCQFRKVADELKAAGFAVAC